ncbi:MAG: gfo/Idh/MocA family oxidoreductase [Acidobacteria bacterium]|nr:MAG: gfo/Idh/MocA family oxidoreductase [Acidobacteriota bacterium]
MKPLRAGVVGVGHLGQHHARVYHELDATRLVGVFDTDRARAEEIAGRFGVRAFDDPDALAREIDIASVAAPTVAHEQAAAPLIDRGVAVLVEKPIAPDGEAGRRMIARAREAGVPLAVGHIERCQPAIRALRERLTDPRYLEIHRLAPFKPRSLDVDVILDLMIHDLDLCRFLIGDVSIRHLDASGTPALTDRIDIASVRLRFDNGAAANLTASRISLEAVRRVRVFEPGRYASCDTARGSLAVFRIAPAGDGPLPQVVMDQVDVPAEEPLRIELRDFAAAAARGESGPCSGEEGLRALELALAIRDAIRAEQEEFR